ncbi:hypothetical protein D1AOALGA4SA_5910 [Olavius algarvensis Delta 1 endosymbiont]|nr:hypothetical protein D1AOALGA4SA_5910 [Olavius algarvensis Delta 1 endosymbiont]
MKTERSDTIILDILAHFRHFPGFSGSGYNHENRLSRKFVEEY